MLSVSDISNDAESQVKANKRRKWNYEEWITEDPFHNRHQHHSTGNHPPHSKP